MKFRIFLVCLIAQNRNTTFWYQEQKLQPKLYEFIIAKDPVKFAFENKISFSEGRVKVWISWEDPLQLDQKRFHLKLEHGQRGEKLTRESIPIDELIDLSEEPYVKWISANAFLPNP